MLLVGIDLVENERIQRSMQKPRFCTAILGETEYRQLSERGFPVQSVAASFCAKEAFGKALGCGLLGFSLREVELLRRPSGAPYLQLSGRAAELAAARGVRFSVSVTHTQHYASAVVVGEAYNGKSENS